MSDVVRVAQFGPVAYGVAVEADWEVGNAGRELIEDLGLSSLARVRQVHGAVVVRAPFPQTPKADGVVTSERGLAVSVMTADCVPVLLWEPSGAAVAAVHAGWRGAVAGVVESALDSLASLGCMPGELHAFIGPCARGCCYEVGAEVVSLLRTEVFPEAWLKPGEKGRPRVDLGAWVERTLHQNGVRQIQSWGGCTICSNYWPSFRRLGAGSGRIVSAIGIS